MTAPLWRRGAQVIGEWLADSFARISRRQAVRAKQILLSVLRWRLSRGTASLRPRRTLSPAIEAIRASGRPAAQDCAAAQPLHAASATTRTPRLERTEPTGCGVDPRTPPSLVYRQGPTT
jgi:hypothetical protein